MTLNCRPWEVLCTYDLNGRNLIDSRNRQNRVTSPNGSKLLNFAFKASFAVDLSSRLKDDFKDNLPKTAEEMNEVIRPEIFALGFLEAFSHEKIWYSGVALGLDFIFYILMVFAAKGSRQDMWKDFGFFRSIDKTKVKVNTLEVAACRVIDYRTKPLGVKGSDDAIENAMGIMVRQLKKLADCVEEVVDELKINSPVVVGFKKTKGEVFDTLEDSFNCRETVQSKALPWSDPSLEKVIKTIVVANAPSQSGTITTATNNESNTINIDDDDDNDDDDDEDDDFNQGDNDNEFDDDEEEEENVGSDSSFVPAPSEDNDDSLKCDGTESKSESSLTNESNPGKSIWDAAFMEYFDRMHFENDAAREKFLIDMFDPGTTESQHLIKNKNEAQSNLDSASPESIKKYLQSLIDKNFGPNKEDSKVPKSQSKAKSLQSKASTQPPKSLKTNQSTKLGKAKAVKKTIPSTPRNTTARRAATRSNTSSTATPVTNNVKKRNADSSVESQNDPKKNKRVARGTNNK